MIIKTATLVDIPTINQLACLIWPTAYQHVISANQIAYMLQLMYSEPALTHQFENGHQFILATDNNVALGFASYSLLNNETATTYKLNKLYVLPLQAKKGIGSLLLNYVCHSCKKMGGTQIILNVNKKNNSVQFYLKNNFAIAKVEVIDIGEGYFMDDYVMQKKL